MKECRICKDLKELSEFHKKPRNKDNLSSACKECTKEIHKKYYAENLSNNPEKRREYYVNKKLKQYLHKSQNFKVLGVFEEITLP